MENGGTVKNELLRRGVTPNKALGQNFLSDAAVVTAIVDAAEAAGADVLEIGPGLGALTGGLCARARRVVAVEKDAALAGALREALPCANLTVETGDFLRADVPALMGGGPFVAVGNLPYYATTPIVEKLLALLPSSITVMVQREAAERFFARPGERVYGPVAVLSNVYYAPRHVLDVPPHAFYPQPEVDSCVVRLVRRAEAGADARAFLGFLKRAFAMRRKTLKNNLPPAERCAAALAALGFPRDARAEALPPEALHQLYRTDFAKEDAAK